MPRINHALGASPRLSQILSLEQMRAAEQALIDKGSSVPELMALAGKGAADLIARVSGGRAVRVICGPGNNGGDGYVIAHELARRGIDVEAVAAHPPKSEAASQAAEFFSGTKLTREAASYALPHNMLVADCLFGSGLTRPISEDDDHFLSHQLAAADYCVAIDLPSGVDCDSGTWLGAASALENSARSTDPRQYDLCIALGAWKYAHFLMPAASCWRAARLVDIGIERCENAAYLLARPRLAEPGAAQHKYSRGMSGVIGGEMGGASMLCARAAMGLAGYVMIAGARRQGPMALVHRSLDALLGEARMNAVCIGPGLGRGDRSAEKLAAALATSHPLVLDGDALAIADWAAVKARRAPLLLTPHEGEFARMLPAVAGPEVAESASLSKPDKALAVAKALGAVVLLKGADSVIASPDGRMCLAPRAPGWLASAGSGDVLAGLCLGALAATGDPFVAAQTALWLHGEAARIAGARLDADRLEDAVPQAIAHTVALAKTDNGANRTAPIVGPST